MSIGSQIFYKGLRRFSGFQKVSEVFSDGFQGIFKGRDGDQRRSTSMEFPRYTDF